MDHYVTVYYQSDDGEIRFKALSKQSVPQFIEEHKDSSYLIVCDPRKRTNTTYSYGKIQKVAG